MIQVYHRPWGLCFQVRDQQITLTWRQLATWGPQRQPPQQMAVWCQVRALVRVTRRLR